MVSSLLQLQTTEAIRTIYNGQEWKAARSSPRRSIEEIRVECRKVPIDTLRGLPSSVDTCGASSKRKRHHFLTHAHKDHLSGIVAFSSHTIYCTRLTKSLVLCQFPQFDDSLLLEIEVGQSVVINDPDGDFKVTAYDATHCPGAAMFLFEGEFGNILHTGIA
ncbi:hypothetical protein HPP92_012961, partial [Vanilla planifolia]